MIFTKVLVAKVCRGAAEKHLVFFKLLNLKILYLKLRWIGLIKNGSEILQLILFVLSKGYCEKDREGWVVQGVGHRKCCESWSTKGS